MLDRKLLRDLGRLRGQVVSVALVLACGIAILLSSTATYQSLIASQSAFYAEAHFAAVFAGTKRAPIAVAARIAAIPGIGIAETRVAEDAIVTVGADGEPLTAHFLSLPDDAPPLLNRLHLRAGRAIEPGAGDEMLASEAFATANQLRPGDAITAILNGRLQRLRVVGTAISAEYVFATRPGDPVPDDRRYGVLWIGHKALSAAFDMDGAFNDVTASLAPGASLPAVLAGLDAVLEPYGGLGSSGRADQSSHRFLSDEIAQQVVMATTIPVVFLGVSIFLLHGMLGRLVTAQREQIAALKALGYANRSIGWHYVKFALVVGGLGAVLGIGLGVWFGRLMVGSYTAFFHFPFLAFHMTAWVPLLAVAGALLAAAAVAAVARLAPAEAMRPSAPPAHRPGAFDTTRWVRRLPIRHRAGGADHRRHAVLARRARLHDRCAVRSGRAGASDRRLCHRAPRTRRGRDRPSPRRAADRGLSRRTSAAAGGLAQLPDGVDRAADAAGTAPSGGRQDAGRAATPGRRAVVDPPGPPARGPSRADGQHRGPRRSPPAPRTAVDRRA